MALADLGLNVAFISFGALQRSKDFSMIPYYTGLNGRIPKQPLRILLLRLYDPPGSIRRFLDVKYRKYIRNRDPHDVHREMSAGTDPAAVPESFDRVGYVWVHRTLRREEAARVECIGVSVARWIAENCPGKSDLARQERDLVVETNQVFPMTSDPLGIKYP